MRILSRNLWWRYGPWERRREAIAATLAEVKPDVCGLQEVWGRRAENLAAELDERLGRHWCWRPPQRPVTRATRSSVWQCGSQPVADRRTR